MLRGELDLVDVAEVAAALTAISAREPRIIVNLAGVELLQTPVANLGVLPEVRTCPESCTKWAP